MVDGVVLASTVRVPFRTLPYKQKQLGLATNSLPQYPYRAFKCKIIMWSNLEELVCMRIVSGECMKGDSAGSNPRLCLEKKSEKWKKL